MEVATLIIDVAVDGKRPPLVLFTVAFRDGTRDSVAMTEDDAQTVALNVIQGVRTGQVLSRPKLNTPEGKARYQELLALRVGLQSLADNPKGLMATDVRAFCHGGGVVVAAAKDSGALFLAVMDPVASDAFLAAMDDSFGTPVMDAIG